MIDKNITIVIETIKKMNGNSTDISSKEMTLNGQKIAYLFLESTSSEDKISLLLAKSISNDIKTKTSCFTDTTLIIGWLRI